MKISISICIPTYNRAQHLSNCLRSIIANAHRSELSFEVCVSDNGSVDATEDVVRGLQDQLPLRYHKNSSNLGISRNFLNVVKMAKGDFVWLIGDDDLLLPNALTDLNKLINSNHGVDFFYVNAFHLTTDYVNSYSQPFDTKDLPKSMTPFSSWQEEGELGFLELINPSVSFDFLGGMFLSVFRRSHWQRHTDALSSSALLDGRTFSHFDNTFPHVKIFSRAFASSRAYFKRQPLIVCLSGAREWAPMYPLVRSVRLVEALGEYRRNGLPWTQYLYCRNVALEYFIPDFVSMLIHRQRSGISYVNIGRLLLSNCWFPNFYLSFFKYFIRKLSVKKIGTQRWQTASTK